MDYIIECLFGEILLIYFFLVVDEEEFIIYFINFESRFLVLMLCCGEMIWIVCFDWIFWGLVVVGEYLIVDNDIVYFFCLINKNG